MVTEDEEIEIPLHGLKLKLDHKYPENRSQESFATPRIIWMLLGMFIRYLFYYIKCKLTRRTVVIDMIQLRRSECIFGVPIGGIGSGSIGRGFRGEFCRFQMKPGLYEFTTVEANQFIVTIKDENQRTIFQSLLSTFPRKTLKAWENLIEGEKCSYTGLYPRSWTEFDLSKYGLILICRQISPIMPHNYQDSSLPCAVFEWKLKNICGSKRTVSIAFTFKNGTGNKKEDGQSSCDSKSFVNKSSDGIIMNHKINGMRCSYIIAAKRTLNQEISKCLYFDPNSDGAIPWFQLKNNGNFQEYAVGNTQVVKGEMGVGIAIKLDVQSNSSETLSFNLVWDMPIINFGFNTKKYRRKYSEIFSGQHAAIEISQHAFQNYRKWEKNIYNWQSSVLNDPNLPSWFKTALFNHLYYISDGGTTWLALDNKEKDGLPDNDPRIEYGRFIYLESHDYKMFNSYDVHFYASFALNMNWPKLQKVLQYDIRDLIFKEVPTKRLTVFDGKYGQRKSINTVVHDVGNPGEEPFILPNALIFHDTSDWKDLNSKFVLQVFRDAYQCKDREFDENFLRDMYDACYVVIMNLSKFDEDGDGLIENEGLPDQTYDTWSMKGPSAYCCGLWLAALFAMSIMAKRLKKEEHYEKFKQMLEKGKSAFEQKLWNGSYYNFDSTPQQGKSIMSDQLCGHWYLRCCGFNYEVFPNIHVKSSLRTIFANNVKSFGDGKIGAVNGFINGKQNEFALFSKEVWTGVTYSLASTMIFEGMSNEGFETAEGLFNSMTNRFGLSFDYPEALQAEKYYRGAGYSRPLSIWSMLLAYEMNQ